MNVETDTETISPSQGSDNSAHSEKSLQTILPNLHSISNSILFTNSENINMSGIDYPDTKQHSK